MKAEFNYMRPMQGRPEFYQYRPPDGTAPSMAKRWRHLLPVEDGRGEDLSLDAEGVVLVPHETSVGDLYDTDQVRERYYPEIEQLVAGVTGAAEVVAFDHNVRNATFAEQGERGAQQPVRFVHNDYTLSSGPQRVRDLFAPDEAEARLAGRFAVINVWRPIVGPVASAPLAVCDASSIAPDDLVPTDLVYRDRRGEVYSVTYNPDHRWLYFPRMQADEALLIKCYDSATDGRARFTAHTAFDAPDTAPDAPARESIEVRTFAFFAQRSA